MSALLFQRSDRRLHPTELATYYAAGIGKLQVVIAVDVSARGWISYYYPDDTFRPINIYEFACTWDALPLDLLPLTGDAKVFHRIAKAVLANKRGF